MSNREKLEKLAEQLKGFGSRKKRPNEFDPSPILNIIGDKLELATKLFKELSDVISETLKEEVTKIKEKVTVKRKYYELVLDDFDIPEDAGIIEIKNSRGQTIGYIVPSDLDDVYGKIILETIELYKKQLQK